MTSLLPSIAPGELAPAMERRLEAMDRDRIVGRMWAGDHTVWSPDPTELANRLGWLSVAEQMRDDLPLLEQFADSVRSEGYTEVLLLGMGGSSLAPEVMATTLSATEGLRLHVLDSTHPDQIRDVQGRLQLEDTMVIVSSKSGGTIETMSLFRQFWEATGKNGSQFVAITDPGTSLERLAKEREFRATFGNPPDLGGRYSALSYFGLVPAVLAGLGARELVESALESMAACRLPARENPGALLGAFLGEAALAGRDRLLLHQDDALRALPVWIEQLVAESTGKHGLGILPVDLAGRPASPGPSEVVVSNDAEVGSSVVPGAVVPSGPDQLGATFFTWEFATAVAGYVLGLNPFDQPDVEAAKAATALALAGASPEPEPGSLDDALASVGPENYVAVLAFLAASPATDERLAGIRQRLEERTGAPVTVGYGPRYLHSTGQLHKGGPNTGVFIQIVDTPASDLPVPGEAYTFARLLRAQADGDLAALRSKARVAVRTDAAGL